MSKARLIYLAVIACLIASFAASFVPRLCGLNDGE